MRDVERIYKFLNHFCEHATSAPAPLSLTLKEAYPKAEEMREIPAAINSQSWSNMRLARCSIVVAALVLFFEPLENEAFITFPNPFTVRLEMGIKDFIYGFLGTNERVQGRRNAARKHLVKLFCLFCFENFYCNTTLMILFTI